MDPTGKRTLSGRVIGDRYGVKSLIGEGGMGEVYDAEHLAIGGRVAIKVLHPMRAQDREAISRLRHEARVAGTLGHPNICAIHDMGRLDDGSPYLVMERLYGETLAQRLHRDGTLPVGDLMDIILQVLSALVAAHQKGIIHRDLKPDNIFLSRREGMPPVPKLLDFGISKAEDIEDTLVDSKGSSATAGTPYYMSPEQARGDRNLDLRVDLWGLGVIMYECLTGKRPFDAKNYNALLVQILTVAPKHVDRVDPNVPGELAQIVDKALSKDRDDRFQSAKEMQLAIRLVCEAEAQPQSKRQPGVRDPDAPLSSKRAPVIAEADLKPASSTRLPPIIVNEPTNDDSDATFIFSRAEMGFPRGASREQSPPSSRPAVPSSRPAVPSSRSTVPSSRSAVPSSKPAAPEPPTLPRRAAPQPPKTAARVAPAPPARPPTGERPPIMPPAPAQKAPPAEVAEEHEDEKTPIYAPFAEEEDHTVVDAPAFLNDSVTMNRGDTIPMPAPRRKD